MAILEGEQMKKQNVGFAFLLLGVILHLPQCPFSGGLVLHWELVV